MEDQAAGDAASVRAANDDDALTALQDGWGGAYEIGYDETRGYWARRRDGLGEDLTAADVDQLWAAIRKDYEASPVPRDPSAPLEDD